MGLVVTLLHIFSYKLKTLLCDVYTIILLFPTDEDDLVFVELGQHKLKESS